MPTGITLRSATTGDHDDILDLVRDAFSVDGRDGQEEVTIVIDSWASGLIPVGLELVAIDHDAVVGHVLAALGDLGGGKVPGVAPLAVSPLRQRTGIGSALMLELLRRAESACFPLVVLLGSPDYYRRFGFEQSGPLNITYPPVGDNPAFQARRLSSYDRSLQGEFTYCWESVLG
jgi:putative acetyltransferase